MSDPGGVIVAGGTGALGRALVTHLVAQGTRVAVPWRRAEPFRALESDTGPEAPLLGLEADLARADGARAFVDEAVRWLGKLDGVALVAGGWAGGARFEDGPEDEWERMLTSNLTTVRHMCRAALPHLLDGGGSVVTVGSRAAETAGAGMAAYAVSKSAVHAFTRVLASENRDRGVRFNCVLPGVIDTPANRKAMPDADRSGWTSPAAIARVMAFLLSSESAPVTGALLPVDGPA
ncbi:MAG: SDR family oxidoreductase [Acidobacteria bacterium]|nr:SDR family oxidoreductase [Acidobacteriota bacterium]